MGLQEKRLAKEIQAEKLPEFEAKVKEITGSDIKVDIDWDTFTAYDSYPLSRLDIVFDDISSFLKKICADDLGKEALQEKLNTIKLTNTDNPEELKMELSDNVLSFKLQLAGSSFGAYTDSQIVSYVESQL
ncbi:hypothetical protein ABWH96_16125 [Marivirga tractuosa]|uniref:hypothetical protein n=1 Tax=Marivirga tractuosa TaxID=1006 RepID=UPI0035CEE318